MNKLTNLSLLLCFLLPACQTDPSLNRDYNDGVSAIQPNDLPVPFGMKLQDRLHKSFSRESGTYRQGDFFYAGEMPVAQVATYLLERMPQHNYELKSKESLGKNHEVLVFKRGRYTTTCIIDRQEMRTQLKYELRTHATIQ